MPERNDASAFNGADDEEEEEEEEEEDEEDDAIGGGDGYDDDDDDELGLSKTKKQTTLVGMLREEEEDLNDDEFASLYNIQPSAHERGLADPPVAIVPGTHVRVAAADVVRQAMGEHWQEVVGLCCKKVGMVIRGNENPNLVFVKFPGKRTCEGEWEGWGLTNASFTLPTRCLEVVFPLSRRPSIASTLDSRALSNSCNQVQGPPSEFNASLCNSPLECSQSGPPRSPTAGASAQPVR